MHDPCHRYHGQAKREAGLERRKSCYPLLSADLGSPIPGLRSTPHLEMRANKAAETFSFDRPAPFRFWKISENP